jgi:hypothetical protein
MFQGWSLFSKAWRYKTAEPFDLRYAAFTSIQRADRTTDAIEIMRRLTDDAVLGRAAASVLHSWRIL